MTQLDQHANGAEGLATSLKEFAPTFEGQSNTGCPVMSSPGPKEQDVLYYWDYLHLDDLLHAQTPKSAERGHAVHDENLFITVHQTSELWFKHILVELDSVLAIMAHDPIPERQLGIVLSRLQRINEIQRLLMGHLDVLETMTPLDFLEFRSLLLPASGFQSVQFRLIENKLGLLEKDRLRVEGHSYSETLRPDHAQLVTESEQAPTMFDHVERWLARNPFVRREDFDFVERYREIARAKHDVSRAAIEEQPRQLEAFEASIRKFDAIFDKSVWDKDVEEGTKRLSYDAFMAALFIHLYRDEPILHIPYLILTALVDIDETQTLWRQRHALLAHRMLGRLTGSAGSGHTYLDETAKRYTTFRDLFDVSTYLVPRTSLPALPDSLSRDLDFHRQ
jgi:tryptophan 2,3-dioxygenase